MRPRGSLKHQCVRDAVDASELVRGARVDVSVDENASEQHIMEDVGYHEGVCSKYVEEGTLSVAHSAPQTGATPLTRSWISTMTCVNGSTLLHLHSQRAELWSGSLW